eukprot:jgi/Mesen1/10234/ME000774S09591
MGELDASFSTAHPPGSASYGGVPGGSAPAQGQDSAGQSGGGDLLGDEFWTSAAPSSTPGPDDAGHQLAAGSLESSSGASPFAGLSLHDGGGSNGGATAGAEDLFSGLTVGQDVRGGATTNGGDHLQFHAPQGSNLTNAATPLVASGSQNGSSASLFEGLSVNGTGAGASTPQGSGLPAVPPPSTSGLPHEALGAFLGGLTAGGVPGGPHQAGHNMGVGVKPTPFGGMAAPPHVQMPGLHMQPGVQLASMNPMQQQWYQQQILYMQAMSRGAFPPGMMPPPHGAAFGQGGAFVQGFPGGFAGFPGQNLPMGGAGGFNANPGGGGGGALGSPGPVGGAQAFDFSGDPTLRPAPPVADLKKKDDTKAFDFIADHVTKARGPKTGGFYS